MQSKADMFQDFKARMENELRRRAAADARARGEWNPNWVVPDGPGLDAEERQHIKNLARTDREARRTDNGDSDDGGGLHVNDVPPVQPKSAPSAPQVPSIRTPTAKPATPTAPPPVLSGEADSARTLDQIRKLIARANRGDQKALANLRRILDANPKVWLRIGDLSLHAEMAWVRLIAAGNQLLAESLTRHLREMKKQLTSPSSSLLERLTIQRIAATWLEVQYVGTAVATEGLTMPQARYWSRRQADADKRYNNALRSLELVRRLVSPAETATQQSQADAAKTQRQQPAEGKCGTKPLTKRPALAAANNHEATHRTNGKNGHNKVLAVDHHRVQNEVTLDTNSIANGKQGRTVATKANGKSCCSKVNGDQLSTPMALAANQNGRGRVPVNRIAALTRATEEDLMSPESGVPLNRLNGVRLREQTAAAVAH